MLLFCLIRIETVHFMHLALMWSGMYLAINMFYLYLLDGCDSSPKTKTVDLDVTYHSVLTTNEMLNALRMSHYEMALSISKNSPQGYGSFQRRHHGH